MILSTLLPAFALALAAPVDLDGAEVACIANSLTAAERVELGGALYGGTRGPGVLNRLEQALAGCARRHGWNQAQALDVSMAAYGTLVRARGAELLDAAGIDHRIVDAWFDALPEAARTSATGDGLSVDPLLNDLRSRGVGREAILAGARTLSTYVRTRVGLERLRRGLSLE
jgi:hypothetical protein